MAAKPKTTSPTWNDVKSTLAEETRGSMFERLDDVRRIGQVLGYGVSDAMNDLADCFGVAE